MSDLLRFDLSKNSIGRPIVFGRVGDGESLSMRVQIFKDGAPFDLTGWVATFEGVTHEERTKVFDSDGIEVTNGKNGEFTYTFPNMAFAVAGSYELAYFSFMKDDKRESTDDFEITVYGNADIDAEEAKTIITEYNKLVKALNEAYQSALEKMNTDYDEVVKRIETIKTEMNKLQAQIDKTVSDAKTRITTVANDSESSINNVAKTVTDAMNAALEELHASDFYTQAETDAKFLAKTDASAMYATKADIYTKTESDVAFAKKDDTVNLAGNQEIAGIKNFLEQPLLNNLPLLNLSNVNMAFIDGNEGQISNVTGANNKEVGVGNSIFYINENSKFISLNTSTHRIVAQEDGVYCFVMAVWVQFGANHNGYYYLNVLKNGTRAPGQSRLWGFGADYLKNRNDATGIYIASLAKGDEINAIVETNFAGTIANSGIKSVLAVKIL